MRKAVLVAVVLTLVGCSKKDEVPAADTSAAMMPPAPAAIALADVAGTWTVTGKNEAGDSTLVTYELTATGDMTGWTQKFPTRTEANPVQVVSVSGDSIVLASGPFESVLRNGVQVTTNTVLRLSDGKLVGRTMAHYAVTTPDSVRVVITEGVKK